MATRAETYAFARPVPYFLERGATFRIAAPIRHGATGALVSPTALGSSVTITRPDGTALVSEAAISVSSSIAEYSVTLSASETLGAGWTVIWTLVLSADTLVFRQSAYAVDYTPANVISVVDLYTRIPELKGRIPQEQGERGDDVGWQPQIDMAYYELLRRCYSNGIQPWRIREITGYYDWLLIRSCQLCVAAIPRNAEGSLAVASKDLYFEMTRAEAALKFQLDNDDPEIRRGASPSVRIAPLRASQ